MQVDVITPVPARWHLCRACEMMLAGVLAPDEPLEDLPPDERRRFVELLALLESVGREWSPRVRFRLIDPRSLPGLWLCLRRGVRRTPTFLLPDGGRVAGAEREPLNAALAAAAAAGGRRRRSPLVQALRDFLYGATVYEMVRDLERERGQIEHLFVLVVFGDFLGIPVLPPYYTLRLLPYVVPAIRGWKLSMLRERDITELFVEEIH
jgi:hypothetical protein